MLYSNQSFSINFKDGHNNMIFDSGVHAISWLVNESSSVYFPATTTNKIIDMLRGLNSVSDGGTDNEIDDKHNARIDLEELLQKLDKQDVELLVIYMGNGINDTIKLIKSSPDWKHWRDKNKNALNKGTMTYSKLIYSVIDKWESLLIENDYMGAK